MLDSRRFLLIEVPSIAFGFDIQDYTSEQELIYMIDVADIIDAPHHDETLITKKLPLGKYSIIGKANKKAKEIWERITSSYECWAPNFIPEQCLILEDFKVPHPRP